MSDPISIDALVEQICALDSGLVDGQNWGERAIFFNPGGVRKKGIYVCTFKLRDGDNDQASKLGDDGKRYRFNISLSPKEYQMRFGPKPSRPAAGQVVDTGHDFARTDLLMPHPVYAWMGWAAIVNPSMDKRDELVALAQASLERARRKF